MRGTVVVCQILCFGLGFCSVAQGERLSREVVPHHYELTLEPDLDAGRFEGRVSIGISVNRRTDSVTLHAVDLFLFEASVQQGGEFQAAEVDLDPTRETATLRIVQPLLPGPATLALRFRGALDEDLRGFYRGHSNGKTYAATQFEATEARRAFPCFDEPSLKATFDLTLVVDRDLETIANGSVLETVAGPGAKRKTVHFAPTPRIATYLVAFAIGDFSCLEGQAGSIPIRVCADPQRVALGRYALRVSEWLLPFFEETFGVPYPFEKLDHLAVADFEAGAMENAAAVLYRETALLVDDMNSSLAERQRVARVVAHEVAHQWFGDLVTMEWWDDLWLKEGFADFMEMESLGVWKPEWEPDLESVQAADWPLTVDTLSVARAIRSQAETPEEINALFDGLSYGKASAVLRMVQAYIGTEAMRAGIRAFLTDYAFGSAAAGDFFDALTEASELPVAPVMQSFVLQPGVPRVRVASRCDGDSSVVELRQDRFFADERSAEGNDQLWKIPICTAPGICDLFAQREMELRRESCAAPLLLNPKGYGYFITEMSLSDLEAAKRVLFTHLEAVDRLVLMRDEWWLVRAGARPIGPFVDLLDRLSQETEPAVVSELLGALSALEERLVVSEHREPFQRWVGEILTVLLDRIGWTREPYEPERRSKVRQELRQALGELAGDPRVLQPARQVTDAFLAGLPVDPDAIRGSLKLAAIHGDEALYDRYLGRMRSAETPQQIATILSTLGAFRLPSLIDRTLELALSDEVRSQDLYRVLGGLADNPVADARSWDTLRLRWEDYIEKYPAQARPFVLPGVGRGICDQKRFAAFRDFAEGREFHPDEMRQTEEVIANCIEFRHRHQSDFEDWLTARTRPDPDGRRQKT